MLIFNSWLTAGKSNIYTAEDDGSHLRCVTSRYNLQRYQRLRISPDHRHLMFFATPPRQETGRFFFWELGGEQLKVYGLEPHPYDMRWLTNEKVLCFKNDKVWITNLGNSEQAELDFHDYRVMDNAPDGNRVLLKTGPGTGDSFYIGYIEQGRIQELIRGEDRQKSHSILRPACWSPDGQVIACVGDDEEEIWLINSDGSNLHKAAKSDYFWREFQWSPDSKRIAFTRSLDEEGPFAERGGVFVKDLNSGEEKQVLTLSRSETWRWAADGQSIVYAKGNSDSFSLLRVNIQTGHVTELIGHAAELKDIDELIIV